MNQRGAFASSAPCGPNGQHNYGNGHPRFHTPANTVPNNMPAHNYRPAGQWAAQGYQMQQPMPQYVTAPQFNNQQGGYHPGLFMPQFIPGQSYMYPAPPGAVAYGQQQQPEQQPQKQRKVLQLVDPVTNQAVDLNAVAKSKQQQQQHHHEVHKDLLNHVRSAKETSVSAQVREADSHDGQSAVGSGQQQMSHNDNGSAPGNADVLAQCTEKSQKDAGKSPKDTGKSPKDAGKSPKDAGKSPKDTDKSPKDAGKSPKDIDKSPKDTDKSLKDTDNSPKDAGKLPQDTDKSLKDTDKSPKDADKSFKDAEKSSKDAGKSPKDADKSQKDADKSPKDADKSAENADSLSTSDDKAHKKSRKSSNNEDKASDLSLAPALLLASDKTRRSGSMDSQHSELGGQKPKYDFHPEKGESDKVTQERKQKYDRNFLLSMQNAELSTQRPDQLPARFPELLLKNEDSPQQHNRSFQLEPWYVVSNQAKDKSRTPYLRQQSRGRPRSPAAPRVIEVRKEVVDLHKSEDAYVPNFKQKKSDDSDEVRRATIERNIRSILNKITPQNFDSCFHQLTSCELGTLDGLQTCVDIVFEKATREIAYSAVFAEISRRLAFLKVNLPEHGFKAFRSLLLSKCQKMFETPLKDQMEAKAKGWDDKIAEEEREDKKKLLEEERDEQLKKAKDQYYGNIRFIGELFIKDVLTANIIHLCIATLLKADNSSKLAMAESLECLCELLRTVGKKIDMESANKERNDEYFQLIKQLVKRPDVESKVRFKLIDVLEMRDRNWQLREMEQRLQEKPMTKEELEKKQQMEEEAKKAQATPQGRSHRSSGRQQLPPVPSSEWTSVPARKQKMDTRKLILGGTDHQQQHVRLGPSRPSWGKGPGRPKENKAKLPNQPQPRDSSGSRPSSREASPHLEPGSKFHRSMSSQELPSRAVEEPRLDKAALERKSKNIMEEWLAGVISLQETKSCFMEIASHPQLKCFVEINAEHLLNENSKELRQNGGRLFFDLLQSQLLSCATFVAGCTPLMEAADDLLADFPLLGNYLGEIFSSLIDKRCCWLSTIVQLCMLVPADVRSGKWPLRAVILSRALYLASGRLGHVTVGESFRLAGTNWETVLDGAGSVQEFIDQHQVTFTVASPQAPSEPRSLPEVGVRIQQAVRARTSDDDDLCQSVFKLVEQEVPEESLQTEEFHTALVGNVTAACLNGGQLNKTLLKRLAPVIRKYVEGFAQEIWSIKAICATAQDVELNSNLLSDIFTVFLDCRLITEESFKHWAEDEASELQLQAAKSFMDTLVSTAGLRER